MLTNDDIGDPTPDDLMALGIAVGRKQSDIARDAGVHPRTVMRRCQDPRFQARVKELRGVLVSQVAGRTHQSATEAVETLQGLMGSSDENVRLKASGKLLDVLLKIRAQVELEERLAVVEAALRGEKQDADGGKADEGGTGGSEPDGAADGQTGGLPPGRGPADV